MEFQKGSFLGQQSHVRDSGKVVTILRNSNSRIAGLKDFLSRLNEWKIMKCLYYVMMYYVD